MCACYKGIDASKLYHDFHGVRIFMKSKCFIYRQNRKCFFLSGMNKYDTHTGSILTTL